MTKPLFHEGQEVAIKPGYVWSDIVPDVWVIKEVYENYRNEGKHLYRANHKGTSFVAPFWEEQLNAFSPPQPRALSPDENGHPNDYVLWVDRECNIRVENVRVEILYGSLGVKVSIVPLGRSIPVAECQAYFDAVQALQDAREGK